MGDKLYQVTHIDFSDLILEAREIDMDVGDVPENELWDISDLGEFRIRLVNGGGVGQVIDLKEWVEKKENIK